MTSTRLPRHDRPNSWARRSQLWRRSGCLRLNRRRGLRPVSNRRRGSTAPSMFKKTRRSAWRLRWSCSGLSIALRDPRRFSPAPPLAYRLPPSPKDSSIVSGAVVHPINPPHLISAGRDRAGPLDAGRSRGSRDCADAGGRAVARQAQSRGQRVCRQSGAERVAWRGLPSRGGRNRERQRSRPCSLRRPRPALVLHGPFQTIDLNAKTGVARPQDLSLSRATGQRANGRRDSDG